MNVPQTVIGDGEQLVAVQQQLLQCQTAERLVVHALHMIVLDGHTAQRVVRQLCACKSE